MGSTDDPTDIRSLAVTVEDVVTALELTRSTPQYAVLRITPPFSGRMRARLHVVVDDRDPETLHVEPERLVESDVPSYPTAVETGAALRADPAETYTVERHHERHVEAVEDWRDTVADAIRQRTTIQTPTGPHDVDVTALGGLSTGESPKRDEKQ